MNVLFLVFNRPVLTRRVFGRIRDCKPERLFLAADGPRPDKEYDAVLCAETRAVVANVDWPCEVHYLFRDENVGCRSAVSSAITWFFSYVEDGVILEDDCLPDLSFFRYCSEMLERYRDDDRVMAVSGNSFQPKGYIPNGSYYFSIYPHCWGWATWRRAWLHYGDEMKAWPALRETDWLMNLVGSSAAARYWTHVFDCMQNDLVDTWDYIWTFACWRAGGLTVLPSVNLVENIGFGPGATHTTDHRKPSIAKSATGMSFPLHHPRKVVQNKRADRYTQRCHFCPPQALRERLLATVANRYWYGKWVRKVPILGEMWMKWRTQ